MMKTFLDKTSNDVITIVAGGDDEYSNVINATRPLNFTKIWCGNFQSFAVDVAGNFYSWGLNDFYQLGNQKIEDYVFNQKQKGKIDTFSALYVYSSMPSIPMVSHKNIFPIPGREIKSVSCGDGFTLFLTKSGDVYSVGKNDKGQLGYELSFEQAKTVSGVKCQSVPTKIPFFTEQNIKIVDIYSGSDFSFAMNEEGHFYSWGCNTHSQLGIEKNDQYVIHPTKATLLEPLGKPHKFVTGWMHAAILTSKGEVFIWGNPFYDYENSAKDTGIPLKIDLGNRHCVDMSSGFHHLAMIVCEHTQYELYTFGVNDLGQCGVISDNVLLVEPKKVTFPESAPGTILSVECGAFHTICKLSNTKIYGFGQNDHHQIGSYSSDTLNYPSIVTWDRETEKVLVDIKCGNAFTYLIKKVFSEKDAEKLIDEKEKYENVHEVSKLG